MTRPDVRSLLQDSLAVLVGLQLSIARNAADMKVFHFGTIRPHASSSGTVGSHALHIQCAWRIVSENAVITGSADRFSPRGEEVEVDDEDPQSGNLQQVRIGALLKGYDSATRSHINATDLLVVMSVTSDPFGGADLLLSGGYRLQIFPNCSQDEDWRIIEVGGRHVVVEGGKVTADE